MSGKGVIISNVRGKWGDKSLGPQRALNLCFKLKSSKCPREGVMSAGKGSKVHGKGSKKEVVNHAYYAALPPSDINVPGDRGL